jgi:NAD(P)-dependent dehydrogenase (short-subunit alcohol dehydrogenase family)
VIGQVVLITGASSGVGRAAATAFAQEGARIVIAGRRNEEGRYQANQLRRLGIEAEFFRADVRQDEDVQALVEFTVDRFEGVDVAVNCAGTEAKSGLTTEQSPESFAFAFETNVLGTILCLKHELLVMTSQRRGSIVNLSCTTGHKAAPEASLFAASKHAVEGLTKSAALEAAVFGVRVNAVAPGPTGSEMLVGCSAADVERRAPDVERNAALIGGIPLKRLGTPEEVANAIVFLASDRASFITGHVLAVDGGKSAT